MIWFTSDTHFGHLNVIRYCGRPFCGYPQGHSGLVRGQKCPCCNLEWMHRVLTDNWNARVAPEDTVYHLGDFAFGSRDKIVEYREKLNGNIVLVLGNHDKSLKVMSQLGFADVVPRLSLKLASERHVYLSHHPQWEMLKDGNHVHYELLLNGHVHEHWGRVNKMVNVGVDRHRFKPVTLEELLATPDERHIIVPNDDTL